MNFHMSHSVAVPGNSAEMSDDEMWRVAEDVATHLVEAETIAAKASAARTKTDEVQDLSASTRHSARIVDFDTNRRGRPDTWPTSSS
jgi:hypothetical protein